MNSIQKAGVLYTLEHRNAAGELLSRTVASNLMPVEGRDHVLSCVLKSGAQIGQWHIGAFEGDYQPADEVTAATIASVATEITAYEGTTRPQAVFGAVQDGEVSNEQQKARMTFTAAKTVRGLFLVSSPVRGGNSGVLLSVVRLPSPKVCSVGDKLDLTARFTLISL